MRALCSRCQEGVAVLEHGQLLTLDLHDDLPVDNKQLTSTRAPLLPLAPASDQSLSLSTFAMVHIGMMVMLVGWLPSLSIITTV